MTKQPRMTKPKPYDPPDATRAELKRLRVALEKQIAALDRRLTKLEGRKSIGGDK